MTLTGTGVDINGGGGISNFARIRSFGTSQQLGFNGGSLTLDGGNGTSDNYAQVQAVNGTQSITGAPNITVNAGTNGADLLGNYAVVLAGTSQTIVANDLTLQAGASGIGNYATVQAPQQNLTVQHNLNLNGGGSQPSSDGLGGGVRIGGFIGGPTDVTLHVNNDVTLSGGSVTGAGIGSGPASSQNAPVSITAGGNVTLNPGIAGSRIGSHATAIVGGDIDITATGNFTLSGGTPLDTVVRTLGNVNISAATANIGNSIIGNTVRVAGTNGVSIIADMYNNAGSITASAPSGDSIKVETGAGDFANSSGPTALTVAGTGRWLVYSTDPSDDTSGGLVHAFRQFGSAPGDAILGSGNGFIHSLNKDIVVTLNPIGVSKVYDGTTSAPLTAANYTVSALPGVDNLTVNLPTTGTFDNRNVGTNKTVSVSGIGLASAIDSEEMVPIYGITVTPATLSGAIGTITPASITVSTSDVSRPFDGTTSASGVPVAVVGSLFGTDTLSGGSYAFSSNGNAGVGKTVTVAGVTVKDGNNGANYVLTLADNNNSSITPAPLLLSSAPVTKVYDATTSAAEPVGHQERQAGSEAAVTLCREVFFAFQDKIAGTAWPLPRARRSSTTAMVVRTTPSATSTTPVARSPRPPLPRSAASRRPTRCMTATSMPRRTPPWAAFAGRLGTDGLTVATGATGKFADRNVGNAKAVVITGITLGGSDAANYTLMDPTSSTSASITPAPLTISTNAVSKTFDGNTSAVGKAVVTAGKLVSGDTLEGGDFAFLNKNVGLNKTVTVAAVGIHDGNSGNNYTVTYVSNQTSSDHIAGACHLDRQRRQPPGPIRPTGQAVWCRMAQRADGNDPGRCRQRGFRCFSGHHQFAKPDQRTPDQRHRWQPADRHAAAD